MTLSSIAIDNYERCGFDYPLGDHLLMSPLRVTLSIAFQLTLKILAAILFGFHQGREGEIIGNIIEISEFRFMYHLRLIISRCSTFFSSLRRYSFTKVVFFRGHIFYSTFSIPARDYNRISMSPPR